MNRCRHRSFVSLEECSIERTPSSSASLERRDFALEAMLMILLGQHLLSSHGKCAVSIVDIAVAAHGDYG